MINWLGYFRRTTSNTSFIPEIDGLRFFAIITVVLYHLNTALAKSILPGGVKESIRLLGGADALNSLGWWIIRLDLGVKVFFAISGFILSIPFLRYFLNQGGNKVSIGQYYLRRLTRLEPPFIISLLFFLMVHVFVLSVPASELWPHLGAGLIYGHGFIFGTANPINPVTWSLETEAQFYLLIPWVLAAIFWFRQAYVRIFISILLIVLSFWFKNQFVWEGHWNTSIFAYCMNFSVGIALAWLYITFTEYFRQRHFWYDLMGLMALFGMFYFYKPQHHWDNMVVFNGCILVYMISAFKGRAHRWFYTRPAIYIIGGMCYSIYLLHYAFLHLSVGVTQSWFSEQHYSLRLFLQICMHIPLVIIISSVFFALIERPCMDRHWPRNLYYKFKHHFGA